MLPEETGAQCCCIPFTLEHKAPGHLCQSKLISAASCYSLLCPSVLLPALTGAHLLSWLPGMSQPKAGHPQHESWQIYFMFMLRLRWQWGRRCNAATQCWKFLIIRRPKRTRDITEAIMRGRRRVRDVSLLYCHTTWFWKLVKFKLRAKYPSRTVPVPLAPLPSLCWNQFHEIDEQRDEQRGHQCTCFVGISSPLGGSWLLAEVHEIHLLAAGGLTELHICFDSWEMFRRRLWARLRGFILYFLTWFKLCLVTLFQLLPEAILLKNIRGGKMRGLLSKKKKIPTQKQEGTEFLHKMDNL